MTRKLFKFGDSQGLIFDAALLELTQLKAGDEVSIAVHEGGSIILTPLRLTVAPEKAASSAKRHIGRNRVLFHRLSK